MILTSRQPHRVTQDELKRVGFKKQQQQSGNETGSALGQGSYSHKHVSVGKGGFRQSGLKRGLVSPFD